MDTAIVRYVWMIHISSLKIDVFLGLLNYNMISSILA